MRKRLSNASSARAGRILDPGNAAKGAPDAHVALLRGVNVGGKHRLAMDVLARMFESAGCSSVETYIQSGNVTFRCPPAKLPSRMRAVSRALEEHLGSEIPLVVRAGADIARICGGNPFLARGVSAESLHVMLLRDEPARADVDALDRERSKGDSFEVRGSEIYLHLPNGVARTKLTNDWFDRALKTRSTQRNWKTMLALRDRLPE